MSKYAGTKTEKNLMEAFAGESQARNKYTYYASAAKKAGYVQMANIFEETANQEKEARTSSGPTCTNAWRQRPEKRALRNWQQSLKVSQK